MLYKILCVGAQWLGSDDGGLFRGFQKNGHVIRIVDPYYYFSFDPKFLTTRIVNRLTKPFLIREFNNEILVQADILKPDLVLIYKGGYVEPATLKKLKKAFKCSIINVYPDISFFTHGKLIPQCVPLYDYFFSTKSFHIEELRKKFNYRNVAILQHAADPNVHYKVDDERLKKQFECDISFIGGYSRKKENILKTVSEKFTHKKIKVWGGGWNRLGNPVSDNAEGATIFGRMYSIAIAASKINLGILSEKHPSTISGDQVTARTFNIPACGGFMIHEKTEEFLKIFTDGENAVTYSSTDDLIEKIDYYLKHPEERKRIVENAYEFVHSYHSHHNRAEEVISVLEKNNLL